MTRTSNARRAAERVPRQLSAAQRFALYVILSLIGFTLAAGFIGALAAQPAPSAPSGPAQTVQVPGDVEHDCR